jgi:hypothetical protein
MNLNEQRNELTRRGLDPKTGLPLAVQRVGHKRAGDVFRALYTNKYLDRHELKTRTGIPSHSTLSCILTELRRSGWIEYKRGPGRGPHGSGRRPKLWRRREKWDDPQPDIVQRRKGKKVASVPVPDPSDRDDILSHLTAAAQYSAKASEHINAAMRQADDIASLQELIAATFSRNTGRR